MRYELSPKNTVIVRGPASVTLLDGKATILGGPIPLNQPKIIASQKQLPVETENHAKFEVVLGKDGYVFETQGSSIPVSWRSAAAALGQMREGKVVIVGASDVGKSTLCAYLVNKLIQDGQNVSLVDADIGQTDLGPPTTIAHAVATQPIASLQELSVDRRLFIGDISPSGVERRLIKGIQRLSSENGKSLTIVNTDGWIADLAAMLYKVNLLTEVTPDLVLALAYSNELEGILGNASFNALKVDASKEVLERSRVDRRAIRTEGYRKFLEGAVTQNIDLKKTQLSLQPLDRAEIAGDGALRNLIVGILDARGFLLEIGILIDVEGQLAKIFSRATGAFSKVEVGYVKLSTSGREIGFL
jgi:polynucleotide 5'-hydroxyl-kinase GRC3/NOL9